jgi:hypothetical protein
VGPGHSIEEKMPKITEIGDDENDGYALVTIRIPKDTELFHQIVEMYRDNKVIHNLKIE